MMWNIGVGKRAGPPRIRLAPHKPALAADRTSPPRFLHGPNKLVCPRPTDPAGQTGRSAGLVLKEFQYSINESNGHSTLVHHKLFEQPIYIFFFVLHQISPLSFNSKINLIYDAKLQLVQENFIYNYNRIQILLLNKLILFM